MLSVENPFYRPKDKQAQADMKKAKFHQPEGDHLTLLTVYKGWERSRFSNPWCFENFVQARSMKRAQDVRRQLVTIMDRYRLLLLSAGKDYKIVSKAITAGFFPNAAKKDPQAGEAIRIWGVLLIQHSLGRICLRQRKCFDCFRRREPPRRNPSSCLQCCSSGCAQYHAPICTLSSLLQHPV